MLAPHQVSQQKEELCSHQLQQAKSPCNVFSRGYSVCAAHGPGLFWGSSRHGKCMDTQPLLSVTNSQPALTECSGVWLFFCAYHLKLCFFARVILPVAGSSVGQSAVRSVSQHCEDDWDKSSSDTYTTCPLSGIKVNKLHF